LPLGTQARRKALEVEKKRKELAQKVPFIICCILVSLTCVVEQRLEEQRIENERRAKEAQAQKEKLEAVSEDG
jgi:hypothetical protein